MINHAHTLLLNISAQRTQLQDPGYEYIPTEFAPLQLPSALATVRRTLFGPAPDLYFLNARAHELLGYIHNTELAAHIYAFDPRVTYWPATANTVFFENAKAHVHVRQTAGAPLRLAVTGTFAAGGGKTTEDYSVVLNNSAGAELVVQRGADTAAITPISDLANPPSVQLPRSALFLRPDFKSVVSAAAGSVELAELVISEQFDTIGLSRPVSLPTGPAIARWLITARANPKPAITTLLPNIELLGEPVFLELFGVAPAEPYRTFKNLWFDHPLPAYRLAGLTLALIYRTHELRNNSNGD